MPFKFDRLIDIVRNLGDENVDCHRLVLDKIHPCIAVVAASTGQHWETVLDHWLSSRKAQQRLVHPPRFTQLMDTALVNVLRGRDERYYEVQLAMERSRWYLNWLRRQFTGPRPTSGTLGMYNWRGAVRIAGLLPRGGGYLHNKQALQAACAANG
eukprot:COSAG04_NODE_8390_length_982_cov_1.374858_1_plen_154_part_10